MPQPGKRGVDYIGVGVGAVILNAAGEVLLLLRKRPPEQGAWTIPGGAVEWSESCADAIRRECREEIGVDVEVGRLLAVVDHILAAEKRHWVSAEFLVRIRGGQPRNLAPDEADSIRWFPIGDLPAPLTQPSREAIAQVRREDIERFASAVT